MLIYVRGAGDLASGIALRLHRAHMKVVMSDLPEPTSVRRSVCFSEAVRLGACKVEEISAERAENAETAFKLINEGKIAVMPDPSGEMPRSMKPDVIVDAIMAKYNTGTLISDAPLVIGVGPGFEAGRDCHAVVETKRGHTLGRVIYKGCAIANTGIPGNVCGVTADRVLRAPADGIFHPERTFGDIVEQGERVANVDGEPVIAKTGGMIRGMLQDGIRVTRGMKAGDVDPRGIDALYLTVSDKSLAIGGGVLEAILSLTGILEGTSCSGS